MEKSLSIKMDRSAIMLKARKQNMSILHQRRPNPVLQDDLSSCSLRASKNLNTANFEVWAACFLSSPLGGGTGMGGGPDQCLGKGAASNLTGVLMQRRSEEDSEWLLACSEGGRIPIS